MPITPSFQTLFDQFTDQINLNPSPENLNYIINILTDDTIITIHPIKTIFQQLLNHPETLENTYFLLQPQNNHLATHIIINYLFQRYQIKY